VLEHVQNPQRVIEESLRVLKPGGCLHVVVPNYGSWWEGHYGILWIPYLSPWLARGYVRLYGRDPAFLDTLQFITYPKLRKILGKQGDHVRALGWGQDLWEERVLSLGFSEWSTLGKLKSILRFVHRVGLARTIVGVGKLLHWETPIILTVQKID
jgi:SAM-dependent methyltransferase